MTTTKADILEQTGMSYRQLDYWARNGLLSEQSSPGTGHRRTYDDRDLAIADALTRVSHTIKAVTGMSPTTKMLHYVRAAVLCEERSVTFTFDAEVRITW